MGFPLNHEKLLPTSDFSIKPLKASKIFVAKCLQVLAFVGGLEFDLMPAPLMEVTTEVCWPDKVDQPDLSLLAPR